MTNAQKIQTLEYVLSPCAHIDVEQARLLVREVIEAIKEETPQQMQMPSNLSEDFRYFEYFDNLEAA